MRIRSLVAVTLLVATAGIACAAGASSFTGIVGSGRMVSRELDYRDFTGVSAGSGARVTVQQGDHYRVTLRMDDNAIDLMRTDVVNGVLQFSLRPAGPFRNVRIQIEVTAPRITDLRLSGGATGTVEMRLTDDRFNAVLSGGARLSGRVVADRLAIDCSGGSTATLDGSTRSLSAEGSGGSRLLLSGVDSGDAVVTISGGSRAELTVSNRIEGSASGGSSLIHAGASRTVAVSTSGGSTIRRR
ncbi:MAG: DUF2807 domain-containing protein [Spirochaetaceae bacterium]|nr:MAG: DUF2807 domain-containing protein [Spirochaetaceae bacterium]